MSLVRPRPALMLFGRLRPYFQVCGYSGFLLSILQSSLLVAYLGLSQLTLCGIIGVVILTFFGLTMATKIIAGQELIIYYHHEIAVIATVAGFLRAAGQPALPYLDVLLVGLGLFLACGRIGCLMAGCCHGRPWGWGVTYGDEHLAEGFPAHLAGVPLFPIQMVESVFALAIAGFGASAILQSSPPGTAFTLYVQAYAAGRFCLELGRGDEGRPFLLGVSEAQWTSLVIAVVDVWAERVNLLPSSGWHVAVPLCLFAAVLATVLGRRAGRPSRLDLMQPAHVREIAEAVRLVKGLLGLNRAGVAAPGATDIETVHVAQTSLGVRISAGDIAQGRCRASHYSLSQERTPLSPSSARTLAKTIGCLEHEPSRFEVVSSGAGVFHVIFAGRDPGQPDL